MSGEPKTLTPAEALRRLREEGMELTFDSNDATPWAVHRERGGTLPEYLHFGQTQEEVLSAALGVPVVARDEAAELRAALREYFALAAELDRRVKAKGSYLSGLAAQLDAAEITLRRLAGGENEK